VDDALRALVEAAGRRGDKSPACSFDAPTAEWSAALKGPAINLFLLEVRENTDGRSGDWADVRDGTGQLVGRRPPLRRYDLHYVVSAWGASVEAQRAVLDRLLAAVPAYDTVPPDLLGGTLAESGLAVRLRIGQDALSVGLVDLWSAFDQAPRATVILVVTAPLLPEVDTELAPPAESLDIGLAASRPRAGKPPVPDLAGVEAVARTTSEAEGDEAGEERRWTTFRVRERLGE
jgi:hypothetical protein